jgi:hypothetical protein
MTLGKAKRVEAQRKDIAEGSLPKVYSSVHAHQVPERGIDLEEAIALRY